MFNERKTQSTYSFDRTGGRPKSINRGRILWSKEAELIKVETCASTEYVKMETRENDFIILNIQDRLNIRILIELN